MERSSHREQNNKIPKHQRTRRGLDPGEGGCPLGSCQAPSGSAGGTLGTASGDGLGSGELVAERAADLLRLDSHPAR